MSQLPKFVATGVPAKITDGLEVGCYLAQMRSIGTSIRVLYATAEEPPADRDSWFEVNSGVGGQPGAFSFRVTSTSLPVWVVAVPDGASGFEPSRTLALARTDVP